MAEVVFKIKNRGRVNGMAVVAFLRGLFAEGYVSEEDIGWVSYDHYDPELKDRTGMSFSPKTREETEQIVGDNGVEFISIGFAYLNHYKESGDKRIGQRSVRNNLSLMVEELNRVAGMLASEFDHECALDIYSGASFSNGRYFNEYVEGGYVEECKFSLGADGEPGWNELDAYNERFSVLACEHSERYRKFLGLLEGSFGETAVYVGSSEV